MKRTILVVLMIVLIATPCLSQEVEPEGISSLHGTVWNDYLDIIIIPFPGVYSDYFYGYKYFYGGRIWSFWGPEETGFYVDMLPYSISFQWWCKLPSCGFEVGLWAPEASEGMSVIVGYWTPIHVPIVVPWLSIQKYNKIEGNFIPEETIDLIYPEQGQQGETVASTLHCRYTTFEKNPPVEIIFNPPDGLTVSNINVASDYIIEFELKIAIDAPLGTRHVIVIYDDGSKVVENSDVVFKVIPPIPAPSGDILSISPNQGEQGTTLKDVTIVAADSPFEGDGVGAIVFYPSDGLTVSNINVISNTEVEFDLEIAVDAPVEFRGVYVVLGDSTRYYHSDEVVFEVLEKTN